MPHSANTSSISCGISPASSLARNSAWLASAVLHPPPLRGGQRQHPDADLVRAHPRPLHPGGDLALGQLEVEHLPGPGVAAAAGQPAAHAVRLQHADEPARPPLLADRAALAPRPDAAVHPDRPGWRPVLPAPAHHSLTASADRVRTDAQVVGGQLGEPAFAGADDLLGQRLLLLDHRVDPLLQRADADELADLDVPPLADAERPVGGLVLHGRVPPPVDVDHVAGRGQVEAGAAGLQRQQEQGRLVEFAERRRPSRPAVSWSCRRAGTAPGSRAWPPGAAAASGRTRRTG